MWILMVEETTAPTVEWQSVTVVGLCGRLKESTIAGIPFVIGQWRTLVKGNESVQYCQNNAYLEAFLEYGATRPD